MSWEFRCLPTVSVFVKSPGLGFEIKRYKCTNTQYYCSCHTVGIYCNQHSPIESNSDQREHRRRDCPVGDEIGRHTQSQAETPIGVEHVNEVGQAVERCH